MTAPPPHFATARKSGVPGFRHHADGDQHPKISQNVPNVWYGWDINIQPDWEPLKFKNPSILSK